MVKAGRVCWVVAVASILMAFTGAKTATAQAGQPTAAYHLRFAGDFRSLDVTADIPVQSSSLTLPEIGADQLPRGWAEFVRIVDVRDGRGRRIAASPSGRSGWTLPGHKGGRVRLRYTVDLRYAHEPWPAGNEQAGRASKRSLFTVTRPIFITGGPEGPATVSFDVRPGWRVATPWMAIGSKPNVFHVESQDDLTTNSFVVGDFAIARSGRGPLVVQVALLDEAAGSQERVAGVLDRILADYLGMFADARQRSYLMTVFYAEGDDGEAFNGSAAFSTSTPIGSGTPLIWANFVAHELLHYWNGRSIRSAERARTRWFSEGATEYLANQALLRTGVITPAEWMQKAGRHLGLYSFYKSYEPWSGIGIADAGEKGPGRPAVYAGGWTAALCLDAEIGRRTRGTRGLRDLMNQLFDRFGKTRAPYRAHQLAEAASSVAGAPLTDFFARYVDGTETLPYRQCLAHFGYDADSKAYAGEVYVRRSSP